MKRFLIAAPASGCGKTSLALGLMRALTRRSLAVQPFKAGPDFIDPGHHAAACGRQSHNLDAWMCPPDTVRGIFANAAADADLAIAEGAMGLFDGASATGDEGSSAQLAKLLSLPVLLVLDASSMARSVAALAKGFTDFDPELTFAGVVCNRVGSARHAGLLRQALGAYLPDVPYLGALPRRESLHLPSRHLGLVTAGDARADLDGLADWVESGLDMDGLLASCPDIATPRAESLPPPQEASVRIGLARDAAFCFTYPYNLQALQRAGAELMEFSPLVDETLPPDLDGLYLPGGYPELHGPALAANEGLRREIAAYCASGRPVYAECGGFMYLMRSIAVDNGRYPMCGVFSFGCAMGQRRAALGYRDIRLTRDTPLGPAGTTARGHEYHYSAIAVAAYEHAGAYAMASRHGDARAEGFACGNVLASYVHLHFGSNPELARNFVRACRAAQ